jgi:hypothetical protein
MLLIKLVEKEKLKYINYNYNLVINEISLIWTLIDIFGLNSKLFYKS